MSTVKFHIVRTEKRWLQGKERNAVRAQLRKALKAGDLEARRTFYDYYDSCHPPVETPDAAWVAVAPDDQTFARELKAGGASVVYDGETLSLRTGYSTWEVRVRGGK